jgi:hypothetical protein
MTEQKRKTTRRTDTDRRTEHRRTIHRRKSNVPVDVENRSNLDQRSSYQRKENRRVGERRH